MANQNFLFTRREFLRTAAIAGAGAAFLPSFLSQTAHAEMAPGKDDPILVVIQLGGGNDGLNTVIPHGNDNYFRARKTLALKKDSLLRLTDEIALHGAMKDLAALYESGDLAIINGVGYPNPDRSHFRSMEIWHTAVESNRFSKTGWIGRYFDNCCEGRPDPLSGVNVGGEFPQAFAGASGAGVAFQEPSQFRWIAGNGGDTKTAFEKLNRPHTSAPKDSTIDFLRHVSAKAVISSDRVGKAADKRRNGYPNSRLSQNLRNIATMIAGGLGTRIYYTAISGFDTHANQPGQHENLLRQFSEAVSAFAKDLHTIGAGDRVLIACFSEFGRRVEENASRGTDHGTAGPMFLLGSGIKAGIHGKYPSLSDLNEGDLKHTVDFRAVYTDILKNWMKVNPAAVVAGKFESTGAIA
jgi:uncharacterized protein (DUF1501 family)